MANSQILRTALFWFFKQRVEAISYRRYGKTYRSYLKGSRIQKKLPILAA